ncbi:hypothetical protein HID58_041407 [Brassica napus]|uniref:Uncharacterized protein n=1 Tax=Brassica napus TaxID=3708 RepID=A0ABQ8BAR9_BRANA|nr:hypothetical protein HID58_041407 [Brassica napus]
MSSLCFSSSSSTLEKQEPESSTSEEAQAVTPWVVSGNVDHGKVIEKFGCDRIDESLICVMNGLNKVTRRGENKVTRTLGSREFMRYYKHKPPPSSQKHIVDSLATREAMDESAEWRRMFDCEAEKASNCNSELALENAALLTKIETLKQELEASRLKCRSREAPH